LNKSLLYIVVLLSFISASCGIYKLNGVTIPETIKSVSVAYIDNKANLVAPELSPALSDKLRTKFLTQTTLRLLESDGDFSISGEVIDYSVAPVGAQDNATASVNRLQIVVRARLVCPKEPQLEFEQTFTQFEDFDASKNLADVESDIIGNLSDNLVQEIFNKATLNW
jgi:Lipopolysaccharide-assembly